MAENISNVVEAPAASKPAKAKKPAGKKGKAKGKKAGKVKKPAARKESSRKVGGVEVNIVPTANGNRYTVAGFTLCGLLRWCGGMGWSNGRAKALLAALGLEGVASVNTIQCQVGSARAAKAGGTDHHPGERAGVDKALRAKLEKLAPKE